MEITDIVGRTTRQEHERVDMDHEVVEEQLAASNERIEQEEAEHREKMEDLIITRADAINKEMQAMKASMKSSCVRNCAERYPELFQGDADTRRAALGRSAHLEQVSRELDRNLQTIRHEVDEELEQRMADLRHQVERLNKEFQRDQAARMEAWAQSLQRARQAEELRHARQAEELRHAREHNPRREYHLAKDSRESPLDMLGQQSVKGVNIRVVTRRPK